MARRLGVLALLGVCLSLMGSAYPLAQAGEQPENRWWVWVLVALVLLALAAYVIWWWLSPKEETREVAPSRVAEVALPEAELPEVAVPDVALPEAELPDVELPEVTVPDVALPEADAPETGVLASRAAGLPDDLKVIEGIGPKIAGVLNAAGIVTFRQLADLAPARILEVLGAADPRLLRLADPTTWPQQARLAADGAWEELQKLTDQLKGGRKV